MHRYNIDYKKLYDALDRKRTHRFGKLSWKRVGTRIHVGASTLSKLQSVENVHANILVNILMFLKRPITDFLVIEKEDNTYDEIEDMNDEKEASTDANSKKRS